MTRKNQSGRRKAVIGSHDKSDDGMDEAITSSVGSVSIVEATTDSSKPLLPLFFGNLLKRLLDNIFQTLFDIVFHHLH